MILDDIVKRKREELALLEAPDLRSLHPSRRNFNQAIHSDRARVSIIAEVKKASPSTGVLCADFDPAAIARGYVEGGAAAVSVLTDASYFQGSLADLAAVSRSVEIPVLRKDFVIDARQIYEARSAGADAVLLIASILDDPTLRRFLSIARSLAMEALVEIHDERELERAVSAGALVIGINNRDLNTFRVDTGTTLRLAAGVPSNVTIVSESGITSPEQLERLAGVVDAALIGTSLMRNPDRVAFLRTLVEATAPPTA